MGKGSGTDCRDAMTLDADADALPDLTEMTAADIDGLWAEKQKPLARIRSYIASTTKSIHQRTRAGWPVQSYEQRLAELELQRDEEIEKLRPFEDEWNRRGGWTRAYLVYNHDGHIHSSTSCHTLHATTQIGWLPDLSGSTEDEIIAHAGHMACTVCYPDAPAHPAFIKGQKEAEAAEAAKKKAICPGSGTYAPVGSYDPMRYSPYGRCGECGDGVSITKTGKYRQHKRPTA